MYLLYQMLGISAIIGSTVCIATMIPLQFFIGKKMSNNAKLTAVSYWDEVLSNMFSCRMHSNGIFYLTLIRLLH